MRQDVFASSQMLVFSPILKENADVRSQYFSYLKTLTRRMKREKRKYTKAQLAFYKEILCGEAPLYPSRNNVIPSRFCYLIPYDLTAMFAYRSDVLSTEKIAVVISKMVSDFHLPANSASFLWREFDAALGDTEAWEDVLSSKAVSGFKRYLKLVKENIGFIRQSPYSILITATMSAGKSTLINALVGKNISLMQNMACTSKIHRIVSKPFKDGVSSEYDHDLSLNASKEELLNDNADNRSAKITVGTYFNGLLGGRRVVLLDSPGVNSSENQEHREISYQMIRSRKYKLLLYVMNATQLGTNDEEQHLEAVKRYMGRAKILFIINRVDNLISEEDNLPEIIEDQRRFLCSKGFQHPLICPVSARAAFLAKKSQQEELSRIEQREINSFIDKFELIDLPGYYENQLQCSAISNSNNEIKSLLKNCGFAYLEQIIMHLRNGGKINGTGLC